MYPRNRKVPDIRVKELLGILVHAGVGTSEPASIVIWLTKNLDCMTSPNSTAPYSEADLSKLLGYVQHLKSVGGNHGFSACVVGKLNISYPVRIFSQYFSGRLMSFFRTPLVAN